ncbi:hypothetical protein [Marinobacter sp. OP 3.4]|uniref:hypothetical protein n=1 Tax=Marinobacter sp. OP 3.4 TaxID=3076501 RepID=UPI002E20A5E0
MIKLLVYRIAPIALRPLAIYLEGMLPGKPTILVLSIPIAMMALTLSSIPVYRDYYMSRSDDPAYLIKKHAYMSGLVWLMVAAIALLILVLMTPIIDYSWRFVAIVCFTFIIEKLSEECSRALEFRKQFFGWFLVQVYRSIWVFIVFILLSFNNNYQFIYLLISAFSALGVSFIFMKVIGRPSFLTTKGIIAIRKNFAYIVGTFLPASYRQLPRIAIVKWYPEQAHTFVALAQLAQGVGILFNVRYQIPYRKLIARRPLMFQRRLEPTMKKLLGFPAVLVMVYLMGPMFIDLSDLSTITQMVLLTPIVVADALLFAIMSVHLGYVQWASGITRAVTFYIVCICIALAFCAVLWVVDAIDSVNLSGIPSSTIFIGLLWLVTAKLFFFKSSDFSKRTQ